MTCPRRDRTRPGHRSRALPGVLGLGLTLAACSSPTADAGDPAAVTGAATAAPPGGEAVVLALSVDSPFLTDLVAGAKDAADAAGVQLSVLDAQDDAAAQADQLAGAATDGTDAVVVTPVDPAAAGAAVRPLLDARIPVVAVDRAIDDTPVTSHVTSDLVDGGRQAAAAVAEAVGFQGQVLHLEGITTTTAGRERGQGFSEGLADTPGVDVVGRQSANLTRNEAFDVTTTLLQANPDVDGVFAGNDEMALGVIQALGDRAGAEVHVIGFGGTGPGVAAVAAGTMTATIAPLPRVLGAAGVEQAVAAIRGEPVERIVLVPVQRVDATNVADHVTP